MLQQRRFFRGAQIWDSAFKDLAWFLPDGTEMTAQAWSDPKVDAFAFLLGGDAMPTLDAHGEHVVGDTLLVLMNPRPAPVTFVLPAIEWGVGWEVRIDTAHPSGAPDGRAPAGGKLDVLGASLCVMRRTSAPP